MKLRTAALSSSRTVTQPPVLATSSNQLAGRSFSVLTTIAAAGGCIATFALTSLFFFQRRLIWIGQRNNGQMFSAADPRDVPGPHQVIQLSPEKVGCYFPPNTSPGLLNNYLETPKTLVYFHGNGDQVGWGGVFLGQSFSQKGFGFFAIEYPGYGIAEGDPREDKIFEASEALLEFIEMKHNIKRDSMVIIGQSIGSATAMEMARRGFGSKLILVSPFLNLHLMAVDSFPFLKPILALFPFFLRDKLDNAKIASKINISSMVLHGTKDDIVPFEHGSELSKLFPQGKCKFVQLKGAAHNNMFVGKYLKKSVSIIEDFVLKD